MGDTPSGRELMLAALKKWLPEEPVCGKFRGPGDPCLRISACQDTPCGLRRKSRTPK